MNLRRTARYLCAVAAGLAAAPALPLRAVAHEIPPSVLVQVFVRPEGQRLSVLVRAPLASMRDIEWPLRGPGYLVLDQVEPLLHDAARIWIADYLEVHEGATPLGRPRVASARVSLPSDPSFAAYASALAHLHAPRLPPQVELAWDNALMDVLLEYDVASENSDFSIRPELAHLGIRTTTVLRFLPPGGTERALQYVGNPGLVRLDPRWHHAAAQFVKLGFLHILEGIDHLLFLLCLVIPFRRMRPLIVIVTSFTVAHSITLMAAALGMAPSALWFPPLIETLIAASIVFMALENIIGPKLDRRWVVAFAFGLVHGFGFSFILSDSLQFAGSHLTASLLAFNVGVELGQLAVLAVTVPALALLFRKVPERAGAILLSALVAHTAWHWMTERGAALLEYPVALPALDLALLASAMRWLMLALIAIGCVWALHGAFGRWLPARTSVAAPER